VARMSGANFVQARYTGGAFPPGNPIGVVLHRTGAAGFDHLVDSWRRGPVHKNGTPKKTSIHFLVGKEWGQVVQMVDTATIADHVGLANNLYVGIEFESIEGSGQTEAQKDISANADSLTVHQQKAGYAVIEWLSGTHDIPRVGPPTLHGLLTNNGRWRGFLSHKLVADTNLFRTDHGDQPLPVDYYTLGIFPTGMMRVPYV
jgi:hypothetical protein